MNYKKLFPFCKEYYIMVSIGILIEGASVYLSFSNNPWASFLVIAGFVNILVAIIMFAKRPLSELK